MPVCDGCTKFSKCPTYIRDRILATDGQVCASKPAEPIIISYCPGCGEDWEAAPGVYDKCYKCGHVLQPTEEGWTKVPIIEAEDKVYLIGGLEVGPPTQEIHRPPEDKLFLVGLHVQAKDAAEAKLRFAIMVWQGAHTGKTIEVAEVA